MTPWCSSVLPGRPTSFVVSGAVLQSYTTRNLFTLKSLMPGTPTWRPHWKVRPESGTAQSSESQSSLAFSMPLSTAAMPASAQKSALFCVQSFASISMFTLRSDLSIPRPRRASPARRPGLRGQNWTGCPSSNSHCSLLSRKISSNILDLGFEIF